MAFGHKRGPWGLWPLATIGALLSSTSEGVLYDLLGIFLWGIILKTQAYYISYNRDPLGLCPLATKGAL